MFTPKASPTPDQVAMKVALHQVQQARLLYDKKVMNARHVQARLIVDALYGRWRYQVKHNYLGLSFGEWVLKKRTLSATYATLAVDTVLYSYTQVTESVLDNKLLRLIDQKDERVDWLTPLIEVFLNHRVKEAHFRVRVTSYTVPLASYAKALSSLHFVRDLVPGRFSTP